MKTGNDDYDDDTVDENNNSVFFFVGATKIGKNLYPSFELKITKNNLLHKCFFFIYASSTTCPHRRKISIFFLYFLHF